MSRLLIYVHFNRYNGLSKHVEYQLLKISQLFDKIIFVSNTHLDDIYQEKILHDYGVDELIIRDNIGYDFAAWRDGLASVSETELSRFESITLMNDTCFGPLWDLNEYYNHFSSIQTVDFWGLTNHAAVLDATPAIPEHLQSYFMVFHKSVITSSIFRDFFKAVQDFTDVQDVIDHYETQLTKLLVDNGFEYKCVLNTLPILDNKTLNFSLNYPKELFEAKVPFIKIKLFERHQFIAPYVIKEIKDITDYPIELIVNHLSMAYLPDSIYKLNYKYIKQGYRLEKQEENIAIHLHVNQFKLFEEILSRLQTLSFSYDLFVTIETEENRERVIEKLANFNIHAKIMVLENADSFALKPLLLMKDSLESYSFVGYFHTFTGYINDEYAEPFYFTELFEMMINNAENIVATLQGEATTGVVISDIPTYFRYRRLIDSDVEHELDELLSQIWKSMKLEKALDFSQLETFVMSYGSFLWFKPKAIRPMFQLSLNNRFKSSFRDFGKSLNRLLVYVAWAEGFDFKISPTKYHMTPFIDNKLLNRRKEIQRVEVVKEIEVINEVIKEVEKPVYPDFYIDMKTISPNRQLLYLVEAPYKAFKFIVKWNILRMKKPKRGKNDK